MILINKKCLNNKINSTEHLNEWYQGIMMKKISKKYNIGGMPSNAANKNVKKVYNRDKKYIEENIIPFFEKYDGCIDEGLINILLTGDFIGYLADLTEEPPNKELCHYWPKILGYYVLAKFAFYDVAKMKNKIINDAETNNFNKQQCVDAILNKYNEIIEEFNSNHSKLKMIREKLSRLNENSAKWNKKNRNDFIIKKIREIKKKTSIELNGNEKFYKNSSGNVNKLCDIETFNNKLKYLIKYEMLDEKQRHIILNTMNISVCPYCNRQYITSYKPSENKQNKIDVITTADLDHFYPKDKFQLFSLSLYNFVPACPICNSRMKLDKPIEILYPYEECFGDKVKFEVIPIDKENESKALFNLLYGKDDILKLDKYKISINMLRISDNVKKKHVEGSIEMFQLEQVYESHKEYTAEIIRTQAIYDTSVHDCVMNTLFNDEKVLDENGNKSVKAILSHLEDNTEEVFSENEKNRILYGINTEDKNQELKKPLIKLTRDILNL